MTEQELELSRQYLNMINPMSASSALTDRKMKRSAHDVDVIIPCYNVEHYVKRCLDSILSIDSRFDIHVIAVDDGSTDSTGEILDQYVGDKRVLVIHQDNRGLSGARNTGLDSVNAKYVFFLDSDDFLIENAIDYLLDVAIKKDANILEGTMISFEDEDQIRIDLGQDSVVESVDQRRISGYTCGKLFKSELFDNICFPENYWFEDGVLAYLILPRAKDMYKTTRPIYAYRMNQSGITATSHGNPKSIDAYWLREVFFSDMDKLGIEIDQDIYEKLLDEIALTYVRTNDLDNNVKVAIFLLTVSWFRDLHNRFTSKNRFHSILEKGLAIEDFRTYCDGCTIVWNSKLS